jgi:pyrroline-5-carboxylate reductase
MTAAAKVVGGQNVGVTDVDFRRAAEFAAPLGAKAWASNVEAAEQSQYLVLAVKPQVVASVLKDLAPPLAQRVREGQPVVLVSIVAGLSINALREHLGGPGSAAGQPVIRLMPNTPALVSKGMIALAASAEVSEKAVGELERILSSAGLIDRVDEKFMDAITALSGSGPAYGYLFIEALADGAVKVGLPRDKALRYAARTVLGAAAMVEETGRHPGELKDAVCSPGGTTIAGVATLEERAFRGTVMAAVEAAYKRSKELG